MIFKSNSAPRRATPGVLAVLLLASSSLWAAPATPADPQAVIHGLDYIGVDYPGVFSGGKIGNPAEYAEQKEIAAHITDAAQALPAHPRRSEVVNAVKAVQKQVLAKAPAQDVSRGARQAIALIMETYQPVMAPGVTPDVAQGLQLYQTHCSGCHGADGRGDGAMAAGLQPPPANFHNFQRQQHRSIYSLYNTISLGVDGTAMRAFDELNAGQRWALAFYVSTLADSGAQTTAPEALLARPEYVEGFHDLTGLVQTSPEDAALRWGNEGVALLMYLRAHPEKLPTGKETAGDIARAMLAASLQRLQNGDREDARELALAAYLDGFELMENQLNASRPDMRNNIEHQMSQYRDHIKDGAPLEQLAEEQRVLVYLISEAEKQLQDNPASYAMNLSTSLLILLREGLEAILVIAALVSMLLKTGRRQDLRYIHIGWSSALLLGLLTWYLADTVLALTGAGRELTEGATALIAAGMLLYVGFWLHNQSHSQKWQQYVKQRISLSLSSGALWGLSLIAFFAVYREVFETVLFYQSLWVGAQSADRGAILVGFASGAAALGILAWLILRYSVRLPLAAFFRVNMLLMFLLAVILAGKGVAAIQEAGRFPIDPIDIPQVPLLGIYPSWESIGVQLALIAFAAAWFLVQRRRARNGGTIPA